MYVLMVRRFDLGLALNLAEPRNLQRKKVDDSTNLALLDKKIVKIVRQACYKELDLPV